MFASRVTKDIPLPSDPSVIVTIRRLSWLQRQAAQKAAQRDSAKGLIDMGGAAFMRELEAMQADKPKAETPVEARDPMLTHDQLLVLVGGVKAWTDDAPVNRDTLGDLDSEDADFLAREILALSPSPEAREKNS